MIGELEIYNQLTQEQVMQYYKTRYVPNNLTFVVVGDVDAEKVRQQLDRHCSNRIRRNRSSRYSFRQNRRNLAGAKCTRNFRRS